MADTATLAPQQATETPATDTSAACTTVVQAAPDAAPAPVPETPAPRRGRTRAVPLLVHGTNATGTTLGAAYTAAGVPGLAAAAGVGAAVGLAALAGRRKKNAAAARKAARDTARNRSGSGSGAGGGRWGRSGGLLSTGRGSSGGAGSSGSRSGGRMNNRSGGLNGRSGGLNGRSPGASGTARGVSGRSGNPPGSPGSPGGPRGGLNKNGGGLNTPGSRLNKNSGGLNGAGPGRPGGSGGGKNGGGSPNEGRHRKKGTGGSGGAWQNVKSTLGKLRRRDLNTGGGKTNTTSPKTPDPAKTAKTPKTPKKGGRSRVSRLLNNTRSWLNKGRAWMNKLSRTKKAATKTNSGTPARKVPGRVYRWWRLVLRTTGHWARCAGAGLLAAVAGLTTLPLSILWGTWRLITKHRDPLHGFLIPVRIAGRIWRRLHHRSRARHDTDARAETLTLTVNDPRKEDPSMGSSLDTSSAVLDGRNSKFALAMAASHASYAGYRPRSMMEVAAEYAGLPNALRSAATTIRDMALASEQRYPCSKRALAKLAEAAARTTYAAARTDDAVTLFRAAHAFDIERILHPRTGEWMWNVTPVGAAVPEGAMFLPGRIESGCVLMSALYRSFEPVHMMQVGAEYEGMSLGLASLADSVSLLHTRTRDLYPVDDRVTDELGTIGATLRAAADDAAMASQIFADDHHREISHNTNPRKGRAAEEMWNTPR